MRKPAQLQVSEMSPGLFQGFMGSESVGYEISYFCSWCCSKTCGQGISPIFHLVFLCLLLRLKSRSTRGNLTIQLVVLAKILAGKGNIL